MLLLRINCNKQLTARVLPRIKYASLQCWFVSSSAECSWKMMVIYHVSERSVCRGVVQVAKTQDLPYTVLYDSGRKLHLNYTWAFPKTNFHKVWCSIYKNGPVCMVSVSLVQLKERSSCIRRLHFILFIRGYVAKWMLERFWSTTRQLGQF